MPRLDLLSLISVGLPICAGGRYSDDRAITVGSRLDNFYHVYVGLDLGWAYNIRGEI